MSQRILEAGILLLGSTACLISSGFVMFAMIAEINRSVPDNQQIAYVFGHYSKYRQIYAEYRRLYPRGKLAKLQQTLMWSGFVLLLILAWRVGMSG